jgi:hypothetical protein
MTILDPYQDYPSDVVARFKAFHLQNPHVYAHFMRLADEMRAVGRQRYGARTIVEVMRWHYDLKTKGNLFKINDDFVPIYARLLIHEHPRFDGFFELRRVRSRGRVSDEEERREIAARDEAFEQQRRERFVEEEDGYLEW